MLAEIQVKRLLKHCENINEELDQLDMCGDEGPIYFDYMKNRGWVQALRLVLQQDTYPISKEPLND